MKLAHLLFYILLLTSCNQSSSEDHLQKGSNYVSEGDWKSAVIEFKNAVKLDPENGEARARLGEAYLETHNNLSALKEFNKARAAGYSKQKLAPYFARVYLSVGDFGAVLQDVVLEESYSPSLKAELLAYRGIAHLLSENKTAALASLTEAEKLDRNGTQVRLAWATLEKANNNPNAQRGWLEPLLSKDGGNADAWSQMGELEHKANNLEAAEEAYSKSISLRSSGHVDMVRRAIVRIARGDLDGAEKDLREISRFGAKWPIVNHSFGLIAYQRDNLDEAQTRFQKVVSDYPEYLPSQLLLAMVNHKKGQYQNSIALLESYLVSFPDQYQANLVYAEGLLRTGSVSKALEVLGGLNKKYPEDANLLSLLGRAYRQDKQPEQSLEVTKQALEANPGRVDLRLQLGSQLIEDFNEYASARVQFKKALELDPDNQRAQQLIFLSYMRERNFSQARAVAQELSQKNPESPVGVNFLAQVFLTEDKPDKAIEILQQRVSQTPDDEISSFNLAGIYLHNGKLDSAKKLYINLLEKNPSSLKVLGQLVVVAARQGNDVEFMKWLEQAHATNPEILSPKLLLASKYLQLDQASKAIQVLLTASEEHKKTPGFILLQARSKLALDEIQHAIRSLKNLVSEFPNMYSAHYLLAQAYAKSNEPDKMRASLLKTIESKPDHLTAQIILARLDLAEGKQEAFKQRVTKLRQSHPGSRDVILLAARLDSNESNFGQAIDKLSSLIEQEPNSEMVVELSKNLWVSGDRQGAISNLEVWTQSKPEDMNAYMILASYYLEENQITAARTAYRKIEKYLPDQPIMLNNVAWLLKDIEPDEGIKYAKRALAISPGNPMILDTLGVLYLAINDVGKAKVALEEAASKAPGMIEIEMNYVRALIAANEKSEARAMLDKMYESVTSVELKKLIKRQRDKL